MSMLDEVGTGRLATATSDVGAARERARGYRLARMALRPGRPDGLDVVADHRRASVRPDPAVAAHDRPVPADRRRLLRRHDRHDARRHAGRGPLAAHHVPPRADRRLAGRRQGHRPGEGRRGPLAQPVPGQPRVPRRDGRHAAPRPALRGPPRHRQDATWPRPWPPRPACRSCSCRPRASSPCTTARPPARSAPTSRRCARPPARRAARSASSRRSTRSRWPARASASSATPIAAANLTAPMCCGGLSGLPGHVAVGRHRRRVRRRWSTVDDVGGHRRGRQRAARPDAVLRLPGRLAEGPGLVHRPDQPVPAGAPPAPAPGPGRGDDPADRGDEPRRQPRPGAAAPGSLRPPAQLRPADPRRAPGAHRPLPGPQGPRGRPRRPRRPRRDRRGHPGLHAGDDRAPLRRGPGQRPAPRGQRDEPRRRRVRPADRGDRHGPAGGLHAAREAADRDPRVRARHDGPPGRPAPPAGGPEHHQAPRRPGHARPRRQRGRVHPLAHRDARA